MPLPGLSRRPTLTSRVERRLHRLSCKLTTDDMLRRTRLDPLEVRYDSVDSSIHDEQLDSMCQLLWSSK